MGRPEKPVNHAGGFAARFAGELRQLRAAAGNPTYREMARYAMFSSSVLSSAASGNRMPSLEVTLAFVTACGGDEEAWRQRWLAVTGGHVRFAARGRLPGRPHDDLPYPAQLPQRPRGFAGRAVELAWLRAPTDTPIVISGTAGVGKTGLALTHAYGRVAEAGDGQLYADLGARDAARPPSPYDVVDGFLRALGVQSDQLDGTPDHRVGLYRTLLVERRLLVLLDNVVDERQVRPLLAETGTSTTVLVSRKRLLGLRDVRRLHLAPLSRGESTAMVTAALPPSARATAEDLDRLAETCGDLPLALDIALRRIAVRPHVVLRHLLDGWDRTGGALDWLRIGDLSVRESLQSAYLTLSQAARMLLHWLARTARDAPHPVPADDDELVDELVDAGMVVHGHHDLGGLRLSPLVREFALGTASSSAGPRTAAVGASQADG